MSKLKKLANDLTKLEDRMNRSNDIARVIASNLKEEMISNLPELGNDYANGGGNALGYVSAKASKQTATLSWTGKQIWYIEFGTGIEAVGKYNDGWQMAEAGGYQPQAYGHNLGMYWTLPMDEFSDGRGKPIVTKGWVPHAPFYKTQVAYKRGKFNNDIADALRKKVDSLL